MVEIPRSHPRYESLVQREKIIEGYRKGIVALAGLIAHGRGEAFDYIIGERTNDFALEAIKAGTALLLIAERPVLSVNGNIAALVPEELVELSNMTGIPLEVNLFYRTREREEAIYKLLKDYGAKKVLGVYDERVELDGLESMRRIVSKDGIYKADVVFIPLEDGDRTETLKKLGKKVITIDLNPLSRTSRYADITIVDNVTRALPLMIEYARKYLKEDKTFLSKIVKEYDNKRILSNAITFIRDRLTEIASKGFV